MGFRRSRTDHKEKRRQAEWLDQRRGVLQAIGVPVEILIDYEHWIDFLEYGELERFLADSLGFSFSDLTVDQSRRLLEFLERHYPEEKPAVYRWLKVRLADPAKYFE